MKRTHFVTIVISIIAFSLILQMSAIASDKEVIVINEPLQVEVANPPQQHLRAPFRRTLEGSLTDGTHATGDSFPVPPGHILVIETISGEGRIQPTQKPVGCILWFETIAESTVTYINIPLIEQGIGISGGLKRYVGTNNVRVYIDPETYVNVSFSRDSTGGSGDFTVSISGYLIPQDSPTLSP